MKRGSNPFLRRFLGGCLGLSSVACASFLFGEPPAPDARGGDAERLQVGERRIVRVAAQTQPAQPAQPAQPVQPVQPTTPPATTTSEEDAESFLRRNIIPTIGGQAPPGKQQTGGASTNVANSVGLAPTDPGDLLGKSANAAGVDVQRRSAISVDPRIRGYHVFQVATWADGAFWTPARIDLDTALGKLNPDNIYNVNVIKGPYSVRLGPGFSFLDVETLPTPRYKEGFEAHGSSSIIYRTNGNAWTGRDYIWGGGCDWGFRLGYDILAGNDYRVGNGDTVPSSYNSHNVDAAFGIDLAPNSHLEIRYLRQMQHDVEYPGLLTDINQSNTDGVEVRYIGEKGSWYDRVVVDGWYNITSFDGDSSRSGKRKQIPQLNNILNPDVGGTTKVFFDFGIPIRLDLTTQAQLSDWGFRDAVSWGDDKCVQLTLGADFNMIRQQYNEFDAFNFSVGENIKIPNNFGIPKSHLEDPGVFGDVRLPIGDCWLLRAGARVDFSTARIDHLGPGMNAEDFETTTGLGADPFAGRHFFTAAGFLTAEYKWSDELKFSAGYGYAERPPSLTELYCAGAFFGLIQNGFNAIYGDPNLKPEQVHQFDIGVTANYERLRGGAHGFFAMIPNYITYQRKPFGREFFEITLTDEAVAQLPEEIQAALGSDRNLQTVLRELRFHNTRMATLIGFEVLGEYDLRPCVTPFATVSYVQGYDQSRHEPLPGMPPLESRVGVRFHEAGKTPRWGLELQGRLVAHQDLVAASLREEPTAGFGVVDVRSYWQMRDNLLLTAGVENLLDKYYREHLDLRTGLGVYQPGINFYVGMRVNY